MRAPREPVAGVAAYDDAVSAAPGPAAPVPLRAARGAVVAVVGLTIALGMDNVGNQHAYQSHPYPGRTLFAQLRTSSR